MNEVPILMSEVEIQEYIDAAKERLEDSGLISYTSKLCHLTGVVTETAGQKNEKCFSASQLRELFELAK